MSRYTCHKCRDEHGTDNMVAYCASCYSSQGTGGWTEKARLGAIKRQRDAAERIVRRALRALAKARKDSARIDFIGKYEVLLDASCIKNKRLPCVTVQGDFQDGYGRTVRQAIDDAVRREKRN